MESPSRKSVLIAGGGLAGLAAAVYLDELGFKVTLLEKKPVCGGRAYSFTDRQTGSQIDNGQHLLIGAYQETIALLERVGAKHKIRALRPTVVPLFDENGIKSSFRMGSLPAPFGLATALAGFKGLGITDKLPFIRLGRELLKIKSGKSELPVNFTVREWLQKCGQTEKSFKRFWEILTLATLNDAPETASADALVTVLLKSYFAGPRDGDLIIPNVNLNEVFVRPILDYLKFRGHTVKQASGVKRILILDNMVRGFETNTGETLTADLYLSALPPHRLLTLLPQPFVTANPKFAGLMNFKYSPIVSINLFYDRNIMDDLFAGSAGTAVHWFFNKGKISAEWHHVVGVASGGYHLASLNKSQLMEIADRDLKKLYPQARAAKLCHALVNVERQATLSCAVGINKLRPDTLVLNNFYLAGDWTNTGLPPTIESAIVSAGNAARLAAQSFSGFDSCGRVA